MKRLVSDAGPLIHLHEASAIPLLGYTGTVFVPEAVFHEARSFTASLRVSGIPSWLIVHSLSAQAQEKSSQWTAAGMLHAGEAATLACAWELQPDWVLTDDTAARLVGTLMGFEVHGSLGILLNAARSGQITQKEALDYLDRLERSSLWLSSRVRSEARRAIEVIFATSQH